MLLIGLSAVLIFLRFFSEAFQMFYGFAVVLMSAPFTAILGGSQQTFEMVVKVVSILVLILPGLVGFGIILQRWSVANG